MSFRQYKIPEFGGYVGVIIDDELLQKVKEVDHGLPLCAYNQPISDIFLTSVGLHLREVFERVNFKLTVLYQRGTQTEDSYIPGDGIDQSILNYLQNIHKTSIQSVFRNVSFQIVICEKQFSPNVVYTPNLQMRAGSEQIPFYVKSNDLKGLLYADIQTPPVHRMMGQVVYPLDYDVRQARIQLYSGVIICNTDMTDQLWFSFIIGTDYSQEGRVIVEYRSDTTTIDITTVKNIIDNQIPESDDPYGEGDNPNPDGGDGTQDDTSDTVDEPEIPSLSGVNTGFISLFNPTRSQLNNLQDYIYGNEWWNIQDALKNIIVNPIQCVLGLHIVPVEPPVSGLVSVKLGGFDSGINMPPITNQFVKKDCGSLLMQPFYNTFLDFQPHTQVEIYLPFIGSKQLDSDLLFSKKNQKYLSVSYIFDVLNGICVAFVKVDNSVMYTFTGQCSVLLPLTQLNQNNTVNFQATLGTMAVQMKTAPIQQGFMLPGLIETGATIAKQNISKTGSIQGDQGYMSNRTPYLTITRPDLVINPAGQRQKMIGYPCEQFYKLGDLKGYTKISEVHLQNIQAPSVILNDIETQLKAGVVI